MAEIPVYEVVAGIDSGSVIFQPTKTRDPLAGISSAKRVTLRSSNADARTLLLWLAQQADANLVVSQDVDARISVNFDDVPVVDAMRSVIAEAGLSILAPEIMSAWPPVVFYQLPVNINAANADAIVARFGVSLELAQWIVETSAKP